MFGCLHGIGFLNVNWVVFLAFYCSDILTYLLLHDKVIPIYVDGTFEIVKLDDLYRRNIAMIQNSISLLLFQTLTV